MLELPPKETAKLLNDTASMLHALWRESSFPRGQGYPQRRMEHIFGIIGQQLATYVRNRLQEVSVWEEPFCKV